MTIDIILYGIWNLTGASQDDKTKLALHSAETYPLDKIHPQANPPASGSQSLQLGERRTQITEIFCFGLNLTLDIQSSFCYLKPNCSRSFDVPICWAAAEADTQLTIFD